MRGGARPRGNSTATCPSPDVRVTYNKHTTATHILVATCRTTLQRAVDCCTLLRGPGCPIRTALSGQTRTPMRCSSSRYNRLGWRHTIGQVAALTAFARSSEARTGAALPRRRPRRGTWRTRATPVVLDGAVWHGTTYSGTREYCDAPRRRSQRRDSRGSRTRTPQHLGCGPIGTHALAHTLALRTPQHLGREPMRIAVHVASQHTMLHSTPAAQHTMLQHRTPCCSLSTL